MLDSDSDVGSDWDSDSADACGPLKQAWGNRDLKMKKELPDYDFVTKVPQDGEEYLLAVMSERRKTPVCVAADLTKIEDIKKRKSRTPAKPQDVLEGVEGSPETTKVVEGVKRELEKLQLETEKNNAAALEGAEFEKIARFLPTPKWRANQLTQFNYIRMKMDLARDMMLQGRYYVVPSFTKFEKDRLYWLRYCFGTLDAQTMIDIKRAKKQKAKEQYEEAKKLKGGSKEAGEEGSSDEDDDVDFVSREEVASLGDAGNSKQAEDVMKISGGSSFDGVIVGSQGSSESSTPEGLDDSSVQTTKTEQATDASVVVETTKSPLPAAEVKTESQAAQPAESKNSAESAEPTGPGTAGATGVESASSNTAGASEPGLPEGAAAKSDQSSKPETQKPTKPEPADDEPVDPVVIQRKLHGQEPTTNLLLSMPQRLVEYLLSVQLEWLKEFGLINRKQGTWLYATMSCLQVPFEPDVIVDLRQIALQCVRIRDIAKQCILESETASPAPSVNSSTSAITLIPHEEHEFGLIDVISSCNLFISIVVDYFVQKDLNKYLNYDGRDDF